MAGDREGFMDVVIGDKHTDVASGKPFNDLLDILDGDGVNSSKGLIEQNKFGDECQGSCNLSAYAFTAGERIAHTFPDMSDIQLLKHLVGSLFLLFFGEGGKLKNTEDILLHGQVSED